MMLKDVEVSGTRVAWRSGAAAARIAAAPSAAASAALPVVAASVATPADIASPPPAAPFAAAVAPPSVVASPAAIAAWIAEQPPETRAAVGEALTPLLAEHWMPEFRDWVERERARGHEAGRQAGLEAVQARLASAVQALAAAHEAAERAFDAEVPAFAERCADIVLESLCKIGGPALATREAAVGAVLNVVARLRSEREVTLRVDARDLEALEASRDTLERALAGRRFALVADPRVGLGGCIVESSQGSLDGRFETQLQGLIETLRAARAQSEGAR